MIVYFGTKELQMLYEIPVEDLHGKLKYPKSIIYQYSQMVDLLVSISNLGQLRQRGGINFEFLKGDKKGQCSLRLNKQYRLLITPMEEGAIKVILIDEISKHYE